MRATSFPSGLRPSLRPAFAPFAALLSALVACSPENSSSTSAYGTGGFGTGGGAGEGGDASGGSGAATPSSSTGSAGSTAVVGSSSTSASSGAGGEGASGQGGDGAGGSGGGPVGNPCPGGFACSDGDCIPYAFFCDGEDDCSDGQDEDVDACGGFIDGVGVCDSELAFLGNVGLNLCAGAACCGEFNACTDNGADVGSCVACFEDGGGALCDDALACVDAECPGGGSGICDSTLTSGELDRDLCLTTECCEEHQDCVGSGSADDIEACVACLDDGGGALCDAAIACAETACPFVAPPGVCDSGLTTNDPEDDVCLGEACCDAFTACTDGSADVDACIACIEAGGGALCDDALDCAAAACP